MKPAVRTGIFSLVVAMGLVVGLTAVAEDGSSEQAPKDTSVYYVVLTSDYDGKTDYQVMNGEEFRKLILELQAEKSLFGRAVDRAKRRWDNDKSIRVTFPGGIIAPRTARRQGKAYAKIEDANQECTGWKDRLETKQEREKESAAADAARFNADPKKNPKAYRKAKEEQQKEKNRKEINDRASKMILEELQKLEQEEEAKKQNAEAQASPES